MLLLLLGADWTLAEPAERSTMQISGWAWVAVRVLGWGRVALANAACRSEPPSACHASAQCQHGQQ